MATSALNMQPKKITLRMETEQVYALVCSEQCHSQQSRTRTLAANVNPAQAPPSGSPSSSLPRTGWLRSPGTLCAALTLSILALPRSHGYLYASAVTLSPLQLEIWPADAYAEVTCVFLLANAQPSVGQTCND